jgi:salicylate 5-hydroxylase small subunit
VKDSDSLLLRLEVQGFFESYAASIDGGAWETFLGHFEADADYQIVSRENRDRGLPLATVRCESRDMLRDRVFGIRETMMYEPRYVRHVLSGVTAEPGGDALRAGANYCVFETLIDQETKILQVGRYDAELTRSETGLSFRRLHCIFDSVIVPNSLIYPI